MHEYSIIQSLLASVTATAQAHGATAVHRVRVRVGELAGVDPVLLVSAFAMCRVATVCEAAELDVETVAVRWQCGACGQAIAAGEVLRCPGCGAAARLVGGDEIVLERVELEVP